MKQFGTYSIKDLEQLSGIKAHTIRIWEVRYGLLKPSRTDTNIRYYDDEQLKRLLNISFLLKNGLKISKISLMDFMIHWFRFIIDKEMISQPKIK